MARTSQSSACARTRGRTSIYTLSPAQRSLLASQCNGLSPEKERELAARIQAGDLGARNELIEGNLALVRHVARHLARIDHVALSIEDQHQEGRVGLVAAASRYKPEEHGTRFSTYATWWIRQAILRAYRTHSRTVRIPNNLWAAKTRTTHPAFGVLCISGLGDNDTAFAVSPTDENEERREAARDRIQSIRDNATGLEREAIDYFLARLADPPKRGRTSQETLLYKRMERRLEGLKKRLRIASRRPVNV